MVEQLKKPFDTQFSEKSLKKMIEDLYNTCRDCLTSKRNRPGDQRLIGALRIPHVVNMLVYVGFVDRPCCETYDYALMIVHALSLFCRVVLWRGRVGTCTRSWRGAPWFLLALPL